MKTGSWIFSKIINKVMIKKRFVIIPLLLLIVVAIIMYRYQILRYSIETVIRKNLPPYVTVKKMVFDLKNSKAVFEGFGIKSPEGFSQEYLLQIKDIKCRYRMRSRNILQGIEILEPVFRDGALEIERLADGRVNLSEMQKTMEKVSSETAKNQPPAATEEKAGKAGPIIKLSDIVKLPREFVLKNGKISFLDRQARPGPHLITFENINANFTLVLDEDYSKVTSFASTGNGNLNGNTSEVVKWVVSLDPTTPKLTMSNRFDVSGADIVSFEPYYDKYSPLVFKQGRFSGTLIFDFDNGSIGSTNEVHLSNLVFYVKEGYENAAFWGTTVSELVKYFRSPYGDIVFDFKIKGDMAAPQFYLGPISKRALASMVIDKVSTAIQQASEKGSGDSAQGGKVKEYIDIFNALTNRQ